MTNDLSLFAAALKLDRISFCLPIDSYGIFQCQLFIGVCTKRHIKKNKTLFYLPADCLGMIDHLVDRRRDRISLAGKAHIEAVSDQNDINIRIEDGSKQGIICRDHDDLLLPLHLLELLQR